MPIIMASPLAVLGVGLLVAYWLYPRSEGFENMTKTSDAIVLHRRGVSSGSLRESLIRRTNAMIDYMKRVHPQDDRTRRLVSRWRNEIRDIPHSGNQAGKTIDKSIIYICMRDADGNLNDENTAFFVLIHELAHVCTPTFGHTRLFWKNMRFLLDMAVRAGVYEYDDYSRKPRTFCGQPITGNPYRCVRDNECTVE